LPLAILVGLYETCRSLSRTCRSLGNTLDLWDELESFPLYGMQHDHMIIWGGTMRPKYRKRGVLSSEVRYKYRYKVWSLNVGSSITAVNSTLQKC
jgi:hypothetical protein